MQPEHSMIRRSSILQGCVAASLLGLGFSVMSSETVPLSAENSTDTQVVIEPIWQLETRAYSALRNDPALARLRIGVTIEGNRAELWGTVPTVKVEEYALELVRNVPGVREATSRMRIVPSEDLLAVEVARRMEQTRKVTEPPPEPKEVVKLPKPTEEIVVAKPPQTPIPIQVREAAKPTPTLVSVSDFRLKAEQIRAADTRYAGVVLRWKEGNVYIDGVVERMSDVRNLASQLATVPGIRRAIEGDVSVR